MAAKLTTARLAELAKELVVEYQGYIHRPENPFGSLQNTSLDDTLEKLRNVGLVPFPLKSGERYRIIDRVHGSPAIIARHEIEFSDEEFAVTVRDELERTKVYQGAQVVKVVG